MHQLETIGWKKEGKIARVYSVATVKSKTLCNLSFELGYDAFLAQALEFQETAQTSDDHLEARRA